MSISLLDKGRVDKEDIEDINNKINKSYALVFVLMIFVFIIIGGFKWLKG